METVVPVKLLRRIAAEAEADPRTVERLLRGQPIRGRALRERILDAARLHNVSPDQSGSGRPGIRQP